MHEFDACTVSSGFKPPSKAGIVTMHGDTKTKISTQQTMYNIRMTVKLQT